MFISQPLSPELLCALLPGSPEPWGTDHLRLQGPACAGLLCGPVASCLAASPPQLPWSPQATFSAQNPPSLPRLPHGRSLPLPRGSLTHPWGCSLNDPLPWEPPDLRVPPASTSRCGVYFLSGIVTAHTLINLLIICLQRPGKHEAGDTACSPWHPWSWHITNNQSGRAYQISFWMRNGSTGSRLGLERFAQWQMSPGPQPLMAPTDTAARGPQAGSPGSQGRALPHSLHSLHPPAGAGRNRYTEQWEKCSFYKWLFLPAWIMQREAVAKLRRKRCKRILSAALSRGPPEPEQSSCILCLRGIQQGT